MSLGQMHSLASSPTKWGEDSHLPPSSGRWKKNEHGRGQALSPLMITFIALMSVVDAFRCPRRKQSLGRTEVTALRQYHDKEDDDGRLLCAGVNVPERHMLLVPFYKEESMFREGE